ncbi:FAD-dependent oxidoreductase [Actinacidiphila acididurans]|uniref:FAD-dependent monooxygenase n=1 Tax=Actinacidiphila acididurans TaxID=2784346 RepID=A0ABS2TXX3_9ACTN|nr:FAD-dependent oxidoreductase [Actinacidiphila acididurans]MBM9508202.1 FAD-dependent monooxygenase [Actinacidiphila acididurans]
MPVRKAVVIGAGIGGLTTAIGLRQAGVDVTVYERRTEPGRLLTGGGFMLWHNVFVALRRLGLDDAVDKVSARIDFHEFRSDRGRRLARWAIAPESRRIGAPAVALRRSSLNQLLLQEAGDAVVLGARFTGFEQDADGVTVHFADGSRERADVLVGADGIRSSVRSSLRHGHDMAPRYAGYTAWQAIADLPGEDVVPSGTFFNLWGRGGLRFLYCRLSESEVYWDAITSDRASAAFDMYRKDKRAVLCETYRDWPEPVRRVLAATRDEAILPIDICDRPPARDPAWGHGRVVLVGDAAHPMTLNLSQGAGQAIEDGVVLSGLLSGPPAGEAGAGSGVPAAIAAYEQVRRRRVDAMVRGAYRIGELGKLRGSLACQARDAFMWAFFGTFAKKGTYRLMMNFDY